MLDIDPEDKLSQELQKYLPDYKLNLIFGANIENPELFRTCLQYIFGMLKYNKDKKQLYQYVQEHKDDIVKAAADSDFQNMLFAEFGL